MACLDDSTLLRFIDNELEEVARRDAEAEIGRCGRCAALVAEMVRGDPALQSGARPSGPARAFGEAPAPADRGPCERYELGGVIARGGMGTILRAFDRRLARSVAVKRLDSNAAALAARFAREIRITASLQHPAIVPVYDSGVLPDGRPFYAMRYVPGASLQQVMAGRRGEGERLGLLVPMLAVAEAVAYAHERGIIHRDLKPSNVLVGPFGEAVVIDWGLAKLDDAPEAGPVAGARPGDDPLATRAGAVLGTPRYMAPEQARGEVATRRSDVYALGAMLYHALSGVPPVAGDEVDAVLARAARAEVVPLARVAPGLPGDLIAVVERAMAPSPEDRYASAGELAADLRLFQTGQLVAAYAYSRRDLVRRFVRRHRAPLGLVTILLAILAVSGAFTVRCIVGEHAGRERCEAEDLVHVRLRAAETLRELGERTALVPEWAERSCDDGAALAGGAQRPAGARGR
ncbi:MAG TPA: serine/threonine-protein kinase [Polyangiaceae bacterium]|nr:serine/threonine-protein kinase [Polyangiaceae bacterium]